MKRLLPCLLLLASGCARGAPAPVSTSGPAPSVAPQAQAPAPGGDCDFRWGYHGTVAGQEVFLRLARTGDALAGRYFYAKVGVDLALAGAIDASRGIDLVEGDPQKPSGRFHGTCQAGGGVLDGTWSDAKGSQAFHLDRVGPRENPLVATKRLKLATKAKTVGPAGMKACVYEQTTVEIFGAGSPEAERALGRQSATELLPPLLSKDAHDDVAKCESGLDATYEESVVGMFRGFVTLERGGTIVADGAAHPSNFDGWQRATFLLSTGKPLTRDELFTRFPDALVKRCVAAYMKGQQEPETTLVQEHVDGSLFALTPEGVHVFGADYPHVAAVFTGQGPVLSWAALLREGVLREGSPARRAWEGVAPAKPGDPECLPDHKGKGLGPDGVSP